MAKKLVINEMFAFVAINDEGDEGLMSMQTERGQLPLVGADMERIDLLRPLAQKFAKDCETEVRLMKFSQMEVLETYAPEKGT